MALLLGRLWLTLTSATLLRHRVELVTLLGINRWIRLTSATLSHLDVELLPRLLSAVMIGADSHSSCVDIGEETAGSIPKRAHEVIEALALTRVSGMARRDSLVEEVGHLLSQITHECVQTTTLVGVECRPFDIQIVDHGCHILPQGSSKLLEILTLRGSHLAVLGLQISELFFSRLAHHPNCRHPAGVRITHHPGKAGHVLC